MKRLFLLGCILSCGVAGAVIDCPDVLSFKETGYHENGWFDYLVGIHSGGDGALFDKMEKFLLSPLYPAPIRKVVLSVKATATAPKRYLRLWPLMNATEVGTNVLDCAVTSVEESGKFQFVSFDFDEALSVDAFRLSLDGSGSAGNWRIEKICVVYGEKTESEDEKLKEFANELPVPTNFRVVDFSKTSLTLAADAVDESAGYRFRISRLVGMPLTVMREDFDSVADSLKMSTGWTLTSENAKLSACTETDGISYVDKDGSLVVRALKIDKGSAESEPVQVEICSPELPEPVTGYSFVSKRASGNDTSNVVTVWGRVAGSETWQPFMSNAVPVSTSLTMTEGAVDSEDGIVQVKFVLSASSALTCRPCALDTLRVIYGGNEKREAVETGTEVFAEPSYSTNGLTTARYECQVQTVGSSYRDSSWSAPLVLDLCWADLTVSAPTGIVTSTSGGMLTVSWEPVVGADHYLVDIVSVDDPELFAVRSQKTSSVTLTLAVPAVGDYTVTVTAVAPGGRAKTASDEMTATVVLDELGEVTAEALDRTTIAAKWKPIPLAESYQAKLVRISGDTETLEYGWTAADRMIVLPEGWTSEVEWEGDSWSSSGAYYPRLPYTDCWIASPAYDRPITRLVCRYKCGTSSSAILENTRFKLEVADGDGRWTTLVETAVTTKLSELTRSFAAAQNIRRIRLTSCSTSKKSQGDVAIGKLSLTVGEETYVEADSQAATKGEVTFVGLDPSARYRVVVAPQPSESGTSSSTTVDLAHERFRMTGAIPLSTIRHGLYEESFDSLSGMDSDTETRKAELDWWQLFKGSGEVDKLLYTAGTNRTTGGVYVFGGNEGFPLLGTLATSSTGCSVGLAFRNDCGVPVDVTSLAFDTVQRNLKGKAATYALEVLVAANEAGIDAAGDWMPIPIPEVAPCLTEFPDGEAEYRQSLTVADTLPELRIPAGSVFLVRWRHEKLSGGPMMAIDNVRIEFHRNTGLSISVK